MNYVVGSFVTYEASAGKCFHPDSKSIAHKSFVKTMLRTYFYQVTHKGRDKLLEEGGFSIKRRPNT